MFLVPFYFVIFQMLHFFPKITFCSLKFINFVFQIINLRISMII